MRCFLSFFDWPERRGDMVAVSSLLFFFSSFFSIEFCLPRNDAIRGIQNGQTA